MGRGLGLRILLLFWAASAVLAAPLPVFADSAPVGLAGLAPGGVSAVTEIVDGDTLFLADGREVRLVGIQAPKLPLGRKNFTKWPLADEAKDALAAMTMGREVTLGYGGQKMDRYGRDLAHLTLPDGRWVQGELLSAGLARVYSFPDNRALVAEMLARERAARAAGRGIWAHPFYAIRAPDGLARDIGTFQLVEGAVLDTAKVRDNIYLNFGADWRSDFTITIRKRAWKAFEAAGIDLLALKGQRVRIRGWLDKRNGPMIGATHPEQLELLGPAKEK